MSTNRLLGKTALITGASRGIGAAIARRLAQDSANIIVNYVSNDKAAAEVVDELNASRPQSAVAIKADVSSIAAAQTLVDQSRQAFGKIDIIVLNAGIMGMKTLPQIDEKFYDSHFDVNVKGPLFLTKAAEPHLSEGARIIFFSSTLAHFSQVPASTLVYAATKGAIEQITRVLAKELGPRGITVNCIAPGPIETELFRAGKTDEMINFFSNLHPLKRLGQPDEVSGIIALLVSHEGSWINGQTILVNGGYCV